MSGSERFSAGVEIPAMVGRPAASRAGHPGDLERDGAQIVSAKVALFGTVVELQNGLRVIPSAGAVVRLDGEPVCWRVFPRSYHYENQMHIIYDDRMEVLSFNHDYFVDQKSKLSGISTRVGDNENIFDSLGLH